jgi:cell fate regulator YaaT (PSP1 superfamily)
MEMSYEVYKRLIEKRIEKREVVEREIARILETLHPEDARVVLKSLLKEYERR